MNMYFQNENNMTTSPAKRLWDNLCIKFTKVWFNLTPNNKSQKQTVHKHHFLWIQIITQIICVTPTELLLWPPLSYNSWTKFAIQNPKVCYSFFIMGSPTCNGIIMHIVLSYLFFQNNINLFSHFICTCNSKDNSCLPMCKWITCKCMKWY